MDSRRKKLIKSSVAESIARLIAQARGAYNAGNTARAKRYARMAFDLLKKHRMRLPKELRNSFCRKCFLVWIPRKTITVSYDSKNDCLRIRCKCGFSKRI